MWLLPSRNRLKNLRRFFRACREIGISTEGMVVVNRDEFERDKSAYEALDYPAGWKVVAVEADSFHDAIRCIWPIVRDRDWIGLLQDDLVPGTSAWDVNLINSLNGWNVVSANDGRSSGRMHGAIVWSGDLARALDGLYPPGFKHLYGDDVWEGVGRETNSWVLKNDVITVHLNQTYQIDADETARRIVSFTEHDKARYEEWCANERADWIKRIQALKAAKGAHDLTVDFTGVSVMIATPSHSNQFPEIFQVSLNETMQGFAAKGVPAVLTVEKQNADIALARSNLFSLFLRTNATHMLMVDDDMGWTFGDVMRLFAAKKDFVAVAGPKKSLPLKFAANHSDEAENMIPLVLDNATGTAEVTEVGAAFALITKQCAMKMAQAYPELQYQGVSGEVGFGVFIPMIHRGRYKAEDFAFCRRWKAIGGKSYICPDVAISHLGQFVFKGALLDQFRGPAIPIRRDRPQAIPTLQQAAE